MSANSIGYNNVKNVENLVKYATGSAIVKEKINWSDGLGIYAGLSLTGQGYGWYKNNKGHRLESLKNGLKPEWSRTTDFAKNLKQNPMGTIMDPHRQAELAKQAKKISQLTEVVEQGKSVQQIQNAKKIAEHYDETKKIIEGAKNLKGKELKAALNAIDESSAAAKLAIHQAKSAGEIMSTTKTGKALHAVANTTGANAAKGAALKAAATSSTVRTASKFVKGNAAFAVISVGLETPEIIQTYKELGKEKGNKQVARVAVTAGAEIAGWAAGMKAGAIAGAAIGSCIPVPVVGTVVGALVGLACGALGGWLAGKAARAVVGKSELQQAQEKQEQQLTNKAMQNPEVMDEIITIADARLKDEAQNGKSKDYEIAKTAYSNITSSTKYSESTRSSVQSNQSSKPSKNFDALLSIIADLEANLNTNVFNTNNTTFTGGMFDNNMISGFQFDTSQFGFGGMNSFSGMFNQNMQNVFGNTNFNS